MRFLKYLIVGLLIVSCSKDYQILESVESLTLVSDGNSKVINQSINFRLIKNNGEDVTQLSSFFVNGQKIQGNTFVTANIGSYQISASYNDFKSDNLLEVIYHDGSETFFTSNVVVEDYTGTWCGNCPRVTHALNLAASQLGDQKDQLIKVAIHRTSSNPADSSYDPFNFDSSAFEPNGGYPKAFVNRGPRWQPLEQLNINQVVSQTQVAKKLGFKLSAKRLLNNQIELSVSGLFAANFSTARLVVYVLEDGLIYNQVNYTTFFGGSNPLVGYVHDYTLRRILTNHLGDTIENATLGNEFERVFVINGTENISNINNTKFVAIFLDENGRALNARQCAIDEIQEDYQIN